MSSRVLACVLWLGVGALFSACGKSEGTGVETREEFATRAASTFCESLGACCSAGSFAFDASSCKSQMAARFNANWSALEVSFDPAAAERCLEDLSAHIECGEVDDDGIGSCNDVFRGKVALGGACSSDIECQPAAAGSVSCSEDGDSEDGVCVVSSETGAPARRGVVGEACNSTCDDRGAGESCDVSVPVPAPGPGGEPVVDPATCYLSDGLYCSFAVSGTCKALARLGEPCDSYDACMDGSFCDFEAGTCKSPQPNGSPCSSSEHCQSDYCDYDSDGANGVCGKRTADAENCEDADFD
jgi:hypothetical protein